MIKVSNLRKAFGPIQAVDEVSFEVAKGETFGLLGPNGAGKTTTIGILVGAQTADSGTVEIEGAGDARSRQIRKLIGFVPQSLAIYDELTAEENLKFFGLLYGMGGSELRDRVAAGLDLSGLTDRAHDRVATFSGGMKRRLNLACGLVHRPSVIFLDEPTVGVDPQSRNHIFETIEQLKDHKCTIIYTTHYMEEASRLCDRIGIMDKGHLLAVDTLDSLVDKCGGESTVKIEFAKPFGAHGELVKSFKSRSPFEEVAQFASLGTELKAVHVERADLETVFLNLTGRTLRD